MKEQYRKLSTWTMTSASTTASAPAKFRAGFGRDRQESLRRSSTGEVFFFVLRLLILRSTSHSNLINITLCSLDANTISWGFNSVQYLNSAQRILQDHYSDFATMMVNWIGLAVPFAYLAILVGSLAPFSSLYRKRKAGESQSLERSSLPASTDIFLQQNPRH